MSPCRLPLFGYEQRELAAGQHLPEVPIKADEMFAQVGHGSRQPGIRQVVAVQLLVQAELPEFRPLRAQ